MGRADMMSIDVVSPTIESVLLNGVSGVLAQSLNVYKQRDLLAFDLLQILQFIVYTAITTPPNFTFQLWLETTFPAKTAEGRLHVRNTIIKFLLDQSVAATVNTAMYICLMGGIKGHGWQYVQNDLFQNFFSLLFASYRFFPFVCLINFAMVPMEFRPYVGSAAGLVWGIYLSLR